MRNKKQFCKHGHDTFIVGRDKSGTCKECAKISIRKYSRKSYKENTEKEKEAVRKWQNANLEKCKAYDRKYQKKHPERCRESCRKWRNANPEKVREKTRKWQKANPEKVQASFRKSELKRKHRVSKYGQDGITEFYINCPEGSEVDHIIPLINEDLVCGLHVRSNLQYLTHHENAVKYNQFDGTLENNSWRKDL